MIREGDRVIVPKDFIRLSLDREKASGTFSRQGMNWFVSQLFLYGIPNTPDEFDALLEQYKEQADAALENNGLFQGLNLESDNDAAQVNSIFEANKGTPEWWAGFVSVLADEVGQAIKENDARRAAWEATRMANMRAMLIFTRDIEKVLWRGYTIEELAEIQSTVAQATNPVVLVEGETDEQYIKTALELLGRGNLLTRIDVRWVGHKVNGHATNTGKDALNRFATVAIALPDFIRHEALLLYDSDANKPPQEAGAVTIRSIPFNLANTRVKKGIENLFPEQYFDSDLYPQFYSNKVITGDYGQKSRIVEFLKADFCHEMCNVKREPSDFQGFIVIADIIDEWVGMQDQNTVVDEDPNGSAQ